MKWNKRCCLLLLTNLFALLAFSSALENCNPLETPDICGFYPSTYANLSLSGIPVLCEANCTLSGGFDLCGVCGGQATLPNQTMLLFPSLYPANPQTRIGGSVAQWNGNVATSQHIAQTYSVIVKAPVVTWTRSLERDPDTGDWVYTPYVLPPSTDGNYENYVPLSRGYGLSMSENYLVVGDHDATPRVVQLWVKSESPPWTWVWTAHDPCAGNYFGLSVTVNERIPIADPDAVYGVVAVGDPAAFLSGRVYVYFTYAPAILQTLQYGNFSTDRICFGEAVDADYDLLAVGSPRMTVSAQASAGSVFIYRWDTGLQEYSLVTQIVPPIPTFNGGFGESVSVWEDFVLIGDNQRGVYLYRIVGMSAVPMPLDLPSGLNLVSRLGYTVGIWDNYLVMGDEEFVPSPTKRGTTFVYDRNPLLPTFYRPMYKLVDEAPFINTRYGAAVSVRGGCFVASGATQRALYGGVAIQDLCRDECYGCDDVLNSCLEDDFCGVCNGDNSTCLGCDGLPNSNKTLDLCGVCGGLNNTCVVLAVNSYNMPCNSTFSIVLTNSLPAGTVFWSLSTPLPTKGVATITGNLLKYSSYPYLDGFDYIYINATLPAHNTFSIVVFTVNISTCPDCLGVIGGPIRPDDCGVCGGDNSTCLGCDGVPNSGLEYDYCGLCGGDNSTCLNIIEPPTIDAECVGQAIVFTTHEPAATPVHWSIIAGSGYINIYNGYLLWNNDGVPGDDYITVMAVSQLNTSVYDITNFTFTVGNCSDCSGVTFGVQLYDLCGVCGGNSRSCIDCRGVPNGTDVYDLCNICGGDNSTCADCFGVPNGGAIYDVCGVCGGDNDTCDNKENVGMWVFTVVLMVVFFVIALLSCCICWYAAKREYYYMRNRQVEIITPEVVTTPTTIDVPLVQKSIRQAVPLDNSFNSNIRKRTSTITVYE